MYHLTNKVYLEVDHMAAAITNGMVISEKHGRRPYLPEGDVTFLNYRYMVDAIKKNGASEESFWYKILTQKGTYVVYLEPAMLLRIKVRYLRWLFPHANVDQLFAIFDSKEESEILNNMFSDDESPLRTKVTYDEFAEVYRLNESVRIFRPVKRTEISFEYLLMNLDKETIREETLRRYRYFADKNFINRMYDLRDSILRLGTNVDRICAAKGPVPLGQAFDWIATQPELNWTLDLEAFESADLFKERYPLELILDLNRKIARLEREDFFKAKGYSDEEIDTHLSVLIFYSSEMIRSVYEDKYEDIFNEMVKSATFMKWFPLSEHSKFNHELVVWTLRMLSEGNEKALTPYRF